MLPFIVIRRCCTSGLCQYCHELKSKGIHCPVPKEKRNWCAQWITFSCEKAEEIQRNWHEYGAEVVPATEETLSNLMPQSAEWVHGRMLKPEHIHGYSIPSNQKVEAKREHREAARAEVNGEE